MNDRLNPIVDAVTASLETELEEGTCPPPEKIRIALESALPLLREMVTRDILARADEIRDQHASLPHDSVVHTHLAGLTEAASIAAGRRGA